MLYIVSFDTVKKKWNLSRNIEFMYLAVPDLSYVVKGSGVDRYVA